MPFIKQLTRSNVKKGLCYAVLSISCVFVSVALGDDQQTIGTVASNIQGSFDNIAKLITGAAYVAGFGFAVASILKFKAHKDNPTQVPVGTPIVLLFISVALIFLPTLFKVGGQTVFGSSKVAGTTAGTSSI